MRCLLLLVPLLACSGGPAAPDLGNEGRRPDGDTAPEHIGVDTGPQPEQIDGETGVDTAPEVETWPKSCPDLYDPDTVSEFDLSMAPADWNALQADCGNYVQQYHPARFTWNGQTGDAMVRLKGNWSWNCSKLQFVVSFNEVDPDARFEGLRKLVLDAPWYDPTLLHERVAFSIFEARGLPYSCANNARLSINGTYYGLYANTERLDREYLERNFEEPDGNLYQGGAELKTNEDVADTSRLQALQAATTVDEIAALVDLDEAVSEWAVEALLPALDNYWAGVEINYYLYDHPSRGFLYLPYDMDITFGDASYTDGTLLAPGAATVDPILYEHTGWRKEELVKRVLADETWCARFVEEVRLAREVWDPEGLAAQVAAWDASIEDAWAEDPRAHYSPEAHAASVAALQTFFATRAAYIDGWLAEGGHCPARW